MTNLPANRSKTHPRARRAPRMRSQDKHGRPVISAKPVEE